MRGDRNNNHWRHKRRDGAGAIDMRGDRNAGNNRVNSRKGAGAIDMRGDRNLKFEVEGVLRGAEPSI